jgi:hypothetical protein
MSVMSRRQPIHRCFSGCRDDVRLVCGRSAGTYRGNRCEDVTRRILEKSFIEEEGPEVEETKRREDATLSNMATTRRITALSRRLMPDISSKS